MICRNFFFLVNVLLDKVEKADLLQIYKKQDGKSKKKVSVCIVGEYFVQKQQKTSNSTPSQLKEPILSICGSD